MRARAALGAGCSTRFFSDDGYWLGGAEVCRIPGHLRAGGGRSPGTGLQLGPHCPQQFFVGGGVCRDRLWCRGLGGAGPGRSIHVEVFANAALNKIDIIVAKLRDAHLQSLFCVIRFARLPLVDHLLQDCSSGHTQSALGHHAFLGAGSLDQSFLAIGWHTQHDCFLWQIVRDFREMGIPVQPEVYRLFAA